MYFQSPFLLFGCRNVNAWACFLGLPDTQSDGSCIQNHGCSQLVESSSQNDFRHSYEAYVSVSAYFAYLQVSVSEHNEESVTIGRGVKSLE